MVLFATITRRWFHHHKEKKNIYIQYITKYFLYNITKAKMEMK